MDLEKVEHIYFLGIGGIGMSALARYFHMRGKKISGYDRVRSIVARGLEDEGMTLFYKLDKQHVAGQDLLIYTPAISQSCEEYVAAEALGIPILKRSQILGLISEHYQTLAVAGTHGKTTTSSMLAHVLRASGIDCTAFLGGIANNINGNFVFGESNQLVVEADEFDRSFLTLRPFVSVITSLDPDHLDIYGEHAEMKKNFLAFGSLSQKLLVHASLKEAGWNQPVETYGISEGIFQANHLRHQSLTTWFDFSGPGIDIRDISLQMPGLHNVLNMTAALAIAFRQGADPGRLKSAAESFSGIYRRFQVHHHDDRVTYIDDYAHHPTEIEAAIQTGRHLFPERQLMVVFQPHLFSRTRDFGGDFARALDQADVSLLMDIYPAREAPIDGIDAEWLLDQMSAKDKAVVPRLELTDAIAQ
ncbi:MAG: UDP-N-acetylmuramate--L-alanine ligase, partial [Bacteroidota bacterium]